MNDSTRLRLSQPTFTSVVVKWYIELQGASFYNFHDLATIFLNHFQLLSSMMFELTLCLVLGKIILLISLATSKSGREEENYEGLDSS
jgi:hypothetical protein